MRKGIKWRQQRRQRGTQRSCRQVNMLLLRAHRAIHFSFVQVCSPFHMALWEMMDGVGGLKGKKIGTEVDPSTREWWNRDCGLWRVPLCFPTHQHHLINLPLLLQALLILLFFHMCHLVFILHMHHGKCPKKKCLCLVKVLICVCVCIIWHDHILHAYPELDDSP